jgi:hypothetical protein
MNDRPRALAVLISIFLAGCIIGAIGFFLWAKKQPESLPFRPNTGNFRMPPGGPRGGGRMNPWIQMLQLSPEQEKSIMQIMQESNRQLDVLQKEYEPKYNSVRAEHEPKIKVIIDDRNRKFSAVLNKDQKKRFEEFQKQFEERRRHGPGGERGGFGRPPMPRNDPSK